MITEERIVTDKTESRTGLLQALALGVIRAYQRFLSPLLGSNCRYHPTCSAYAAEAIEIHGAAKGSWLGIKRIGRCHPFREGGVDYVPGSDHADETTAKGGPSC